MRKVFVFLKKNFYSFLIIFLAFLISFLNYKPGTWLSGWDTLHPEFNFPLNFKRLFFGVWREDQGLGAVASHSHMADLPRVIILWIFSLLFPFNFLRYFYIFLCLILGPLGVFYFLKYLTKREWPSFLGALFYFFNFGTLQHFYVPFEMFCAQYAALGWLFFLATKFLKEGERRDLVYLAFISFLSAPQAYAPTLFYVYFLMLGIYLFFLGFLSKKFLFFKRSFFILGVIFLVNSFWILPNFYFLKTSAKNVPEAKINLLFSEEAFLKNKKYGMIQDAAILKNFLFSWLKTENGQFVYLLKPWLEYFEQYSYLSIFGYLVFGFVLLGIVFAFLERSLNFLAFFPIFLISLFFILGLNFQIPLLQEAFRMPFTKFSLILMLVYSVYFAKANEWFGKRLTKVKYFFIFIWLLFLTIYCFPYFKGELIGSLVKVKFPQEYFQVFNWFNKQKNLGRIANFPSPVYAGWEYYSWGFQGAGFFWFGEKMPLLTRDFDRWNPTNENYYHEISYALYSKNLPLFEKVLEKYQINWLLVDGNVVSYTSPKSLYLEELEELIAASSKISLAAQFGKIKIYEVNLGTKPKDFVFLVQDLPEIGPVYKWGNYDKAYEEYGDYFTSEVCRRRNHTLKVCEDVYYPFRSLFTGRRQEELEFKIKEEEDSFVFWSLTPEEFEDGELEIASGGAELVEINPENLDEQKEFWPEVNFKNGLIEVKFPKIKGLYGYDSRLDREWLKKERQSCDAFNKGQFGLEKIEFGDQVGWRLSALDQASCLDLYLPNLENRFSYLIKVESRYLEGKSLLFWLENFQSRKADIETYLPKGKRGEWKTSYFIQPPMAKDGVGYSLHFNNISIGRVKSVNDLLGVTIYPIPYKFLTGIKIVKEKKAISGSFPTDFEVNHPNESFYKVKISSYDLPSSYLVLSQSYSRDWLAFNFRIENWRLKFNFLPHFLVNNWENGWYLDKSKMANSDNLTIYIFFWPQILEYLGFGFLFLLVPLLIFGKKEI